MRKVAVLKDVFRGTPHALLVKMDSGNVIAKPITEYGKTIFGDSLEFINPEYLEIPHGVIMTPFSNVTKSVESLVDSIIQIDDEQAQSRAVYERASTLSIGLDARVFDGREVLSLKGQPSAIAETPLSSAFAPGEKAKLVAFKAKKFKTDRQLGTVANKIVANSTKFNRLTNSFSAQKFDPFSSVAIAQIHGAVSNGRLRRTLFNEEATESKGLARRVSRRVKSLMGEKSATLGPSTKQRLHIALKDFSTRR